MSNRGLVFVFECLNVQNQIKLEMLIEKNVI